MIFVYVACTLFALSCQASSASLPSESRLKIRKTTTAPRETKTPPYTQTRLVDAYPKARWRLADPSELTSVVLTWAHILVRHREIEDLGVSFSSVEWNVMPPPPNRSRNAALQLATTIASRAKSQPSNFSALAVRHSEDPISAVRAGQMGSTQAMSLGPWPQILDVLSALSQGKVSRVVETKFGFHIIRKLPSVPDQNVSGSRIVIGHTDAPFLRSIQQDKLPQRTREEGHLLAQRISKKLATDPTRLFELVHRYSEHPSRLLNGSLGQWSTREPTDFPTQVGVLSQLEVGEVSAPIETLFGWEVLLREPLKEHPKLAMSAILFPVELGQMGREASQSEDNSFVEASRVAKLLQHRPEKFSSFQENNCCTLQHQWEVGHAWPPLTHSIQALEVGEIGPDPIAWGGGYVVVKRRVPMTKETAPWKYQLPNPEQPDLQYFLFTLDAQSLETLLRAVERWLVAQGEQGTAKLANLHTLHDEFLYSQETIENPKFRYKRLTNRVKGVLGLAQIRQYKLALGKVISQFVLR